MLHKAALISDTVNRPKKPGIMWVIAPIKEPTTIILLNQDSIKLPLKLLSLDP